MNVIILPEAEDDIADALDHYAAEAPENVAAGFMSEVMRSVALLADLPGLGHKVTPNARAVGLRRYPYNLVYCVTPDALVVVAVAHHKRDPRYWQAR